MGKDDFAVVDGQGINVATLGDAVQRVMDHARAGKGFSFFTLNLDHLVKRREDAAFRDAYARATFVSADGAPVVTMARRSGARLERTTGADLVLPVCAAAARAGVPVYLFGCTDQSLSGAIDVLRQRFSRLDIRGAHAPAMGFDPFSELAEADGARIAASGAAICFVALGAPKQEFFADRMAAQHPSIGFLCIGAALDFVSGAQVRAPALMQRSGLEWLWRLATDPRRMAARYSRCAALLAELRLIAPLRGRLVSGS